MKIRYVMAIGAMTGMAALQAKAAGPRPTVQFEGAGHTGKIDFMAFGRDGKTLFSAGDDKVVRVWDLGNPVMGKHLRTLHVLAGPYMEGMIHAGALSPDNRLLALGGFMGPAQTRYESSVRVIDPADGRLVAILQHTSGAPLGLRFSADGQQLVCGAVERSICIWNLHPGLADGDWQRTDAGVAVLGDLGWVNIAVAFASADRLVSGGYDRTVRFWDRAADGEWKSSAVVTEHSDHVRDVACSPDGHYAVTAGFDRTLRLWDVGTGKFMKVIGEAGSAGDLVAFMPDGKGVFNSTGRGGMSRCYSIPGGQETLALEKQRGVMTAIAVSPDGRLLATTTTDQCDVSVYDASTGLRLCRFVSNIDPGDLAFSADGQKLACGSTGQALDLSEVKLSAAERQAGWQKRVTTVAGLSVRKVSREKLAITRDAQHVCDIRRSWGWDAIHSFTFLPGAAQVAVGSDLHLTLNDATSGKEIREFAGVSAAIRNVAVSPDGQLLAAESEDGVIRLWNATTGELLITGYVGRDGKWAMVTPSGYFAAAAGAEASIGWLMSDGPDRSPLFTQATAVAGALNRPDIIRRVTKLLSVDAALAESGAQAGGAAAPIVDLPQLLRSTTQPSDTARRPH